MNAFIGVGVRRFFLFFPPHPSVFYAPAKERQLMHPAFPSNMLANPIPPGALLSLFFCWLAFTLKPVSFDSTGKASPTFIGKKNQAIQCHRPREGKYLLTGTLIFETFDFVYRQHQPELHMLDPIERRWGAH